MCLIMQFQRVNTENTYTWLVHFPVVFGKKDTFNTFDNDTHKKEAKLLVIRELFLLHSSSDRFYLKIRLIFSIPKSLVLFSNLSVRWIYMITRLLPKLNILISWFFRYFIYHVLLSCTFFSLLTFAIMDFTATAS